MQSFFLLSVSTSVRVKLKMICGQINDPFLFSVTHTDAACHSVEFKNLNCSKWLYFRTQTHYNRFQCEANSQDVTLPRNVFKNVSLSLIALSLCAAFFTNPICKHDWFYSILFQMIFRLSFFTSQRRNKLFSFMLNTMFCRVKLLSARSGCT